MGGIKTKPLCKDIEGACFARKDGECTILTDTACPCHFKKPDRSYTNGVHYPYNPASSVEHEVMSRKKN